MNKYKRHELICHKLNDLYQRKNSDYGDAFARSFNTFGLTMSAIRLQDKVSRLTSLATSKNQQIKDESIRDTLMDIANYAIMTIIEMEETDEV